MFKIEKYAPNYQLIGLDALMNKKGIDFRYILINRYGAVLLAINHGCVIGWRWNLLDHVLSGVIDSSQEGEYSSLYELLKKTLFSEEGELYAFENISEFSEWLYSFLHKEK